jgi:hypothetical protein
MTQYRVNVEETNPWQKPVLAGISTPPVSPTKGDRYIVVDEATGDFTGKENQIAWYDGTVWKFDVPSEGWYVYALDPGQRMVFDGTNWEPDVAEGEGDMTKAVYDTDDNGIVDKAESVDDGEGNTTTAAQVKESYDRRAQWDADLGALIIEI